MSRDSSFHADVEACAAASNEGRDGAEPVVDAIVDARFRVEGLLGRGGMGQVFCARHLELNERVAIKFLLPEREPDKKNRARLLREARAAVRIKSEHVVRVFDVVGGGATAPFIVMEYLEGETVAERLQRRPTMTMGDAAEIVVQSCEAVGEGHHLGIVHRDLKPSNLFLWAKPGLPWFVKVLDFGISKIDAANGVFTRSDALLASPAYAPPEQLRASADVDQRADIWALGVILYQCLTGQLPFRGTTLATVCTQILQEVPEPPTRIRPEIPRALERVVMRCLEKEPSARFTSARDLVAALQPFAPDSARRCLPYLDALGTRAHMANEIHVVDRAVPIPEGPTLSAATVGENRGMGSAARSPWRRFGGPACLLALAFVVAAKLLAPRLGQSGKGPLVDVVRPASPTRNASPVTSMSPPLPSAMLPPANLESKAQGPSPAISQAAPPSSVRRDVQRALSAKNESSSHSLPPPQSARPAGARNPPKDSPWVESR